MSAATTSPTGVSRASLLTPIGRGAVAVIAATGSAAFATADVHFSAANRLRLSAQRINRVCFGHWAETADATQGEEVIVCRTSEDAFEIHCHGGLAASERILTALASHGCRIEPWVQWIRSHAASLEADAESALASALTCRTAAILLDQRHGALRRALEAIRADLSSHTPASRKSAAQRLTELIDLAPLGRRLTHPWLVAIAGRPNVGKSSLINALVGYERAIVFDQPGTTRDVLAAETAVDGWPLRLTDSAGLRETHDELESAGVHLARQQLQRADLVLWVLDVTTLPPADFANPRTVANREMAIELAEPPTAAPLVVVNKSDLAPALASSSADGIATSALTGAGLAELLAAISARLVPHPPAPGAAIPFTDRQVECLLTAQLRLNINDATGAKIALADLLDGDSSA